MIDTHAHINDLCYDNDIDDVIALAHTNGIKKVIVVGTSIESSTKAIMMAKMHQNLYPTAGFHPTELDNLDFALLEAIIKNNKIYAIGECGIDLYWNSDNLELQKEVFIKQIELAIKYDLPIIIHTRNSFNEAYECLLPYQGKIKGVFHCFSGTLQDALKAIEIGFFLGIGGVVTFKNAIELKSIVEKIDLRYLLLETDCPYLSPTPFRGKRNEPAYIKYIIKEISNIKNVTIEVVDEITSTNATTLFGL